ncbi:MAG: hypothetical protein ABW068_14150, partial [Candidatus Thiodiazotropha sp.]
MKYWAILWLCFVIVACGGGDDEGSASSSRPGGLILDARHGDEGSAWGLAECDACHALSVIHEESSASIREMVRDKGYLSRCQPGKAKRRLVVPGSREAILETRRAVGA